MKDLYCGLLVLSGGSGNDINNLDASPTFLRCCESIEPFAINQNEKPFERGGKSDRSRSRQPLSAPLMSLFIRVTVLAHARAR